MDETKRRINPQNPRRFMRGRKQKKRVLLSGDVAAPSVPAVAQPEATAVPQEKS